MDATLMGSMNHGTNYQSQHARIKQALTPFSETLVEHCEICNRLVKHNKVYTYNHIKICTDCQMENGYI